jgi:flagellar biosynthesis protein FlhF
MQQGLRKFRAPTYYEAYQQVRRSLGNDAVILRSAEVKEGGVFGFLGKRMVELTASGGDPQPPLRAPSPAERKYGAHSRLGKQQAAPESVAYFEQLVRTAQQRIAAATQQNGQGPKTTSNAVKSAPFLDGEAGEETIEALQKEIHAMREMLEVLYAEHPGMGLPSEFVPHYKLLIERGVDRKVAAAFINSVVRSSDLAIIRDPRVFAERMAIEVRKRVQVTGGISLTAGTCRLVALVGPTGVGKTTNLAKLAAYYAMRTRSRVALLTADTYRIAAADQLRVYANIIGVPLEIVNDPAEAAKAVQAYRDYDLLLMDTAGGSQYNMKQINELKSILEAAQADEVMLVLSANTQLDVLRGAAVNFRPLRPSSLLFSKLDETRLYGAMLSLVAETDLPLSYLSVGQNVPDDIVLAQSNMIADLILQNGVIQDGSSKQTA